MHLPTEPLPWAYGGPPCRGSIKLTADDFRVDEILSFEPGGGGEHVYLWVEKRGENTDYVARQLARFAGCPKHAVSVAGLKDRHGLTRQWFSVHLPGNRELDWSQAQTESIRILDSRRSSRKLKTGAGRGNRFEITIRELTGDLIELDNRLAQLHDQGAPNYFGPQRFGHNGGNIEKAMAVFDGSLTVRDRHLKGLYLSAARSLIFNAVLAERVRRGNWNQAIDGDVFTFGNSRSVFRDDDGEPIAPRLASLDVHPTGPLWGKGEWPTSGEAGQLEQAIGESHAALRDGLIREGLECDRRALRVALTDLDWQRPAAGTLQVGFSLPAGCYATAVLREAINFDESLD